MRRAPPSHATQDFVTMGVESTTCSWRGSELVCSEIEMSEQGQSVPAGSSDDVRAFYERLPYPRPLASLDEHRDLYKNPDHRRALFHLMWPTEPLRENQEILVAGCGTSQAARYALREPGARITAIDVSETSLRYTRDLQRKYGLENLDLHQLSIENVRQLGRTFDQIVCTGVLHHLPDPDLGLHVLRDVLNPQGAMHLMVYAAYGRAGIYMIQDYCRLLGISSSDKDLRDLGATLQSLPMNHPLSNMMRQAADFRHPDALADALLHPLDRAYTVPELYAWLERCGMSFGRWMEQAPYLAQCGMMAKIPHSARLASLPAPLQHAAVELFRGTMVKHNVIAYRDDRAGKSQPIAFVGDRWREYVPIRLPWAVCVRERVPPGSVAVLINKAHTFTDLILTVNIVEDRLLGAIDGKRTLGEILRFVGKGCDERRAVGFFEQLWQYDQVVFDASQQSGGNSAPEENL
jgi:SAM-dependent methyltransferase